MEEVSLFEEALKIAGEDGGTEDLGEVSNVSRRDFEERATFLFRAKAPCLEYVSLMIENALLLRTNRSGRVFAGFEKLSRMEEVAARYLRIADISERVYVFGEPDWQPPRHPNVRVITLARGFRLAREWFVIADSPNLTAALIGLDEDGLNAPALEERRFRAFKSTDAGVVARLAALAEEIADSALACT